MAQQSQARMNSVTENQDMEQLLSPSYYSVNEQQMHQQNLGAPPNDFMMDDVMETPVLNNEYTFQRSLQLNEFLATPANHQPQIDPKVQPQNLRMSRSEQLRSQGTQDELSLVNTNNTLVSNDVGHSPLQDQNAVTPENGKLFGDLNWSFGMNEVGNKGSVFGDSTTLGSETRTSNEFVDNFESINEDEVTNYRSRFTNSISNSISNIFKSSSNNSAQTNRFNLRVINPLATHRDPDSLVQQLPNLVETVENLSIEHDKELFIDQAQQQKKKKCTKMMHSKNCDCAKTSTTTPTSAPVIKKKRSTTTSIVNALANARLGFNSNKQKENLIQESFFDDLDHESLLNESVNLRLSEDRPIPLDFDEELSRVISMASKSTSTYNFNNDLHSLNVSVNQSSIQQDQNNFEVNDLPAPDDPIYANLPIEFQLNNGDDEQEMISNGFDQPTDGETINSKDDLKDESSPDYAALFSDVNPTKKKSKTLSFRKMTLSQPKTPIVKVDDTNSENEPTIIIPLKDSTRGRKPSMEYDATKTFVCTYCSRRFRRQEHLKRHFRSLHTNQKPFDCTLCGKKFSRSDNLTQHIKTHEKDDSL